jgi:hypothetical protein
VSRSRPDEAIEVTLAIEPGVGPEEAFFQSVIALGEVLGLAPFERAVQPRAYHYQPRSRLGRWTRAGSGYYQPREIGGRFRQRLLPGEREAARQQARRIVQDEMHRRLHAWMDLYELGRISSSEWAKQAGGDIRWFYEEIYRQGQRTVGDPAIDLSPQDRAIVNRLIADELDWLKRFADDMDAGRGRMPYRERLDLYVNATWEVWWNGWVIGDQRSTREIRWVFGGTIEHCKDCQRFVTMGWTPVRRFFAEVIAKGYAPRSGHLACGGWKCKCRLEERITGQRQPAFHYGE